MVNPFNEVFGAMVQFQNEHSDEEYFAILDSIRNTLHQRGGSIETSDVLKHIEALESYRSNMILQGATNGQLDAFYKEALSDLYPLERNVRMPYGIRQSFRDNLGSNP